VLTINYLTIFIENLHVTIYLILINKLFKMKNLGLMMVITIILFVNKGFSQYTFTSYKHSYFEKFLSSETLVPITGIQNIDSIIKETLDRDWKFTKLKFVPINEIEQFSKNGNVSIINLLPIQFGNFGNSSLCLYVPGNFNITRMTNVISSVPIKCGFSGDKKYNTECSFEQIGYKIDILFVQLIEVIKFMKEEKYIPLGAHITGVNKYVNLYNKKIAKSNLDIKLKTLLINENFFNNKMDSVIFKKYYSYKFKVVTENEYQKIISSDNENYFVMLQSNIPNSVISVFDLQINKTLFIDLNFQKNPFTSSAKLRKLNLKQVKKLDAQIEKIASDNN